VALVTESPGMPVSGEADVITGAAGGVTTCTAKALDAPLEFPAQFMKLAVNSWVPVESVPSV
jgi:hypothetical protein